MEKSNIKIAVAVVVLFIVVLVANNSTWFVPDRFSGNEQVEDAQEGKNTKQDGDAESGKGDKKEKAVEIMEKAEKEAGGYRVSAGIYYFDSAHGGISDILSNDDNMAVDGKILNKGCCLENYMPAQNGTIKIEGKGTVSFRSIEGKALQLNEKKGVKIIQNSGYYLRDAVMYDFKRAVVLSCKPAEGAREMPKVQIQDTYTKKVVDEFQWTSGKETYKCKLAKGQSLYVDLGKETKDVRNCILVGR